MITGRIDELGEAGMTDRAVVLSSELAAGDLEVGLLFTCDELENYQS